MRSSLVKLLIINYESASTSHNIILIIKEKFHLPSLFVQHRKITGLEHKIVCQERKRPLQFRSIIDYPPESTRILLLGLIARTATKSEMVTLILDGINDADDFPEAVAAGKLSEHHHKKLVPACECLHILVSVVLPDDSIKYSLRQKLNELAEKIFSVFHAVRDFIQTAKMHNQFKSTRAVFLLTTDLITTNYKERLRFSLDTSDNKYKITVSTSFCTCRSTYYLVQDIQTVGQHFFYPKETHVTLLMKA